MDSIKTKLKEQLTALYSEGVVVYMAEYDEKKEKGSKERKSGNKKKDQTNNLKFGYQAWYSKSLPVIRRLLPERYREFQDLYKLENRKTTDKIDFITYTISDYLIGLVISRGGAEAVDRFAAFSSKFQHQLTILASAKDRVDSLLSDIEGVLQTEMFQHELDAAEDLLGKGHLRAAGALAGVSLETHLGKVCDLHELSVTKKAPTISDFNDTLKGSSFLDVPTWRLIQRLSDIRNLCVHAKEREPTREEIDDLLSGTKKILSTVN